MSNGKKRRAYSKSEASLVILYLLHVDLSFPPTIMREKIINIGSHTQNIVEKRIKNEGELRDTKNIYVVLNNNNNKKN
jgi:hypothetical protein